MYIFKINSGMTSILRLHTETGNKAGVLNINKHNHALQ